MRTVCLVSQANVSIKRLTAFLCLEELDPENVQRLMPDHSKCLLLFSPRHRGNAHFLPCGHLGFESAVIAQNDDFKVSFDISSSRSLNVKTSPRNSKLSLGTY